MTFGEFVEQLRLEHYDSLRSFCLKNKYDPGNHSKLERSLLPAPKDRELLEKLAKALKVKEGSDEWYRFFDLAVASHGSYQIKNVTDKDLLEKLPVLFRAVDRDDLTAEELDKLIEKIRKG